MRSILTTASRLRTMSSWAVEQFGESLVTKDGVKKTSDVMANKKLIAIYFSAQWCPPCRGFTPSLCEFYEKVKAIDADQLEIVFVSSDNEEEEFRKYFATMPFAALPYADGTTKQKLGAIYGVRGIPSLYVMDPAGKVLDATARGTVTANVSNVSAALQEWAN